MNAVMFTGSRGIPRKKVHALLDEAVEFVGDHWKAIDHAIVGGAIEGVDGDAYHWAQSNSINTTVVRANWNKYGKAAGPIRNKEMADFARKLRCKFCIAIWDGQSRGTLNTIKLAAERGISLIVMKYPENKMFLNPRFYYEDTNNDFHFGDNISDIHAERVRIDFKNYPTPEGYSYNSSQSSFEIQT